MITHTLSATLDGQPCIKMDCILRAGAEPSSATIQIDETRFALIEGNTPTLVLSDGVNSLTLNNLTIRRVHTHNGIVALTLADARITWNTRVLALPSGPTLADALDDLLNLISPTLSIADLDSPGQALIPCDVVGLSVAEAIERLLLAHGQGFWIDSEGTLRALPLQSETLPSSAYLLEASLHAHTPPASVAVFSGLERQEILVEDTFDAMLPDDDGNWRELEDVLDEWSVDEEELREVLLAPDGIGSLGLSAMRQALLRQHAYRSYRIPEAQLALLPLEARSLDGSIRVEHTGSRRLAAAPVSLIDPFETPEDPQPAQEECTFDGNTGIVTFDRVVAQFEVLEAPVEDHLLHSRVIAGPPETIRLTCTLLVASDFPLASQTWEDGEGSLRIRRNDLIATRTATQTDPEPANFDELTSSATLLIAKINANLPLVTRFANLAGPHLPIMSAGSALRIRASQAGMTSELRDDVRLQEHFLNAFAFTTKPQVCSIGSNLPMAEQPALLNSWRRSISAMCRRTRRLMMMRVNGG